MTVEDRHGRFHLAHRTQLAPDQGKHRRASGRRRTAAAPHPFRRGDPRRQRRLHLAGLQRRHLRRGEAGPGRGVPASLYVWLFAFYLVQYFVIIFFNTALVGAALDRLEGRDPTLRSALALAVSRIGPIFGYAILSATVGLLLRFIGEKLGIIGRIIEAGAGLAWTVTTFLVVPVLAAEGVGPIEAVERSVGLLKKTWGENIVGSAGISLVMGFATFAVVLGFMAGVKLLPAYQPVALALMTACALAFIAVLVFSAALSAVYSAAVYYYAVSGEPPIDFDRDMVRGAFGPKGS